MRAIKLAVQFPMADWVLIKKWSVEDLSRKYIASKKKIGKHITDFSRKKTHC